MGNPSGEIAHTAEKRGLILKSLLVGPPGFEPGTSCTPSKRASQAAPRPEHVQFSVPGLPGSEAAAICAMSRSSGPFDDPAASASRNIVLQNGQAAPMTSAPVAA